MRLVVIVIVGIAVGLIAARLRAPASAPAAPPAASARGSAPAAPPPARWAAPLREPSVPQRELAQSDRRYDPLALLREERDAGITTKDIFEREPRDAAFAPVLEQRAHAALDRVFQELRLEDKVRDVRTECRTLSCYTFIEVDDPDVEHVYDRINGILIGDSQSPSLVRAAKGRPAGVTLYNLYRPAARDDAYYRKLLEEAMQPPLELAKKRYLEGQDAAGR
jgi:hypothetical protein